MAKGKSKVKPKAKGAAKENAPLFPGKAGILTKFRPKCESVDAFDQRVRRHIALRPTKTGKSGYADRLRRELLLQLLPLGVRTQLRTALRPRALGSVPVAVLLTALRAVCEPCERSQPDDTAPTATATTPTASPTAMENAPSSAPATSPRTPMPPRPPMPNARPRLQLQRLQQGERGVGDFATELEQLIAMCGYDSDIAQAVAKDRLIIGLRSFEMRTHLLDFLDRPGGATYWTLRNYALHLEDGGNPVPKVPRSSGMGYPQSTNPARSDSYPVVMRQQQPWGNPMLNPAGCGPYPAPAPWGNAGNPIPNPGGYQTPWSSGAFQPSPSPSAPVSVSVPPWASQNGQWRGNNPTNVTMNMTMNSSGWRECRRCGAVGAGADSSCARCGQLHQICVMQPLDNRFR